MIEEHRDGALGQQAAGGGAEEELAEDGLAVGPHDEQAGAESPGLVEDDDGRRRRRRSGRAAIAWTPCRARNWRACSARRVASSGSASTLTTWTAPGPPRPVASKADRARSAWRLPS